MAGEQKRFARFFFYLRNLREAALHTGARAEEAEDRGLELLHSAETEAELKKLEEAKRTHHYRKFRETGDLL